MAINRHRWKIIGITGVVALGILGILGAAYALWLMQSSRPSIPGAIRQQLTSTLLLPQHTNVRINRPSVKYDNDHQLLSMNIVLFGTPAVMSQQPAPESFIDIPEAYDKVVESMNEYAKFDTEVGAVHLTHPKELDGKQAAVLNTKGTLVFVKPENNLSNDDWKRFFHSLSVAK